MQPFVEFVDIMGSVASALDSTIPCASAIFRVVKSIFLASKALGDLQAYLVDLMVDKISGNLGLIGKYRELFQASPELLHAAIDIYQVVLEIGTRAVSFFYDDKGKQRSGLRLFVSTAWSSCKEDLEAMSRRFDVRSGNFSSAALLAHCQATESGLQAMAFNQSQQGIQLQQLEAGLSQQVRLLVDNKTQQSDANTAVRGRNPHSVTACVPLLIAIILSYEPS